MTRLACALLLALVNVAAAQVATTDDFGPASKQEVFQLRRSLLVEGTNVHLENMVVRAKSGLMLRVAYGDYEIFVAPVNPSSLEFVAVGARLDVRGTLRQAPSAGQARLVYAMKSCEARRLARQRVYVDAWSITTSE